MAEVWEAREVWETWDGWEVWEVRAPSDPSMGLDLKLLAREGWRLDARDLNSEPWEAL